MSKDYETYSLGDWELKGGGSIKDAHIAYKTFGDSSRHAIIVSTSVDLTPRRSLSHGLDARAQLTLILKYPSWYSGSIADNEWLIGEDKT